MRFALTVAPAVALFAAGTMANAQYIDDNANCKSLTKPGLYYFAYPDSGGPVTSAVGSAALHYEANSRFYFIAPTKSPLVSPGEEAVWHIRTQTRATAAPTANTVYVYRPGVVSRCSSGARLPEYAPDQRFVGINSYIDYHAPNHNGRDPNPGLHDFFHFQIQDAATGQCIRTDDEGTYGNLTNIYGFPDITRSDTVNPYERYTSLSRPAVAETHRYQGLSSEFAYRDAPDSRCFAFTAPLPTGPVPRPFFSSQYSAALDAARAWHPMTTLIVVKRLRGKRILEAVNRTIIWGP